MESLIATQSQTAPTPATPQQRTIISEITSTPVFVAPVNQPSHSIPSIFPWGMPLNHVPEGYAPTIAPMLASRPIMSTHPPVVHVMPCVEETIYNFEPSEGPNMYENMDKMKE